MVIKWIWKKTLPVVQDWFESKDGQEYVHEVLDAEIDRQIARLRSSAGGVLHNPAGGGGQTLIGGVLQALLPKLLGQALNSSPASELAGDNPFGKV